MKTKKTPTQMRHGATANVVVVGEPTCIRWVGEPTCIRWVEDARGRQKDGGRSRRRQREEGLNRRGRREGDPDEVRQLRLPARQEDVGNHTD